MYLFCTRVTKDVKNAKREYEKKLAAEIKDNPKAFWKYVRSKTKVKSGIKDLKKRMVHMKNQKC